MAPDRDELKEAVSHVCYELQRTQQLPDALKRARSARDEAALAACFEAFFLHLRNLLEFLDTPKPARISARDYLGPKQSIPKSDALKRLRDHRNSINYFISHLMWERVTKPPPRNYAGGKWEIADFAPDIAAAFESFIEKLGSIDDEAAEWFRERLRGDITDGAELPWDEN